MLGAWVGERIERLDAVHTASGVRLRIVHYLGQDVDAADDVLLGALAFCCPRSNSMNLGFLDRSDQFVIAAEQLPGRSVEAPSFLHVLLGADSFGETGHVTYELMVILKLGYLRARGDFGCCFLCGGNELSRHGLGCGGGGVRSALFHLAAVHAHADILLTVDLDRANVDDELRGHLKMSFTALTLALSIRKLFPYLAVIARLSRRR